MRGKSGSSRSRLASSRDPRVGAAAHTTEIEVSHAASRGTTRRSDPRSGRWRITRRVVASGHRGTTRRGMGGSPRQEQQTRARARVGWREGSAVDGQAMPRLDFDFAHVADYRPAQAEGASSSAQRPWPASAKTIAKTAAANAREMLKTTSSTSAATAGTWSGS